MMAFASTCARALAVAHRRTGPLRVSGRARRAAVRARSTTNAREEEDGADDDSRSLRFSMDAPRDVACVTPSRLDAYIASALTHENVSRARIALAIRAGLVRVNDAVVRKPSWAVRPGDAIRGAAALETPSEAVPEPELEIDVVYEDSSVIVVNKSAGMVVHPSAGHARGTLVNAVLGRLALPATTEVPLGRIADDDDDDIVDGDGDVDDGDAGGGGGQALDVRDGSGTVRPGIVHRLDKGTSGVMVVAKDAGAHNSLCDQFASRMVRRRYVAIVSGVPSPSRGRIEAPIGRDPKDRLRMAVTPGGGRFAASNYEVIAVLAPGNASMVEWRLETGRTHQIRVHAKHIGHPILGDDTYGGGGGAAANALSKYGVMTPKDAKAIMSMIARPMLHARTLGFEHPKTGEAMDFSRDPPEDFAKFAERLADK